MSDLTAKPPRVLDHRYFYGVGIAFVILVFVGFARTYYLKGFYGAPPLSLLVHIHGAVMTMWYALFLAQVRLVATHRVDLHRKLGIAGVFLAGLVAVLATLISLGLAKHRLLLHPDSTGAPLLLGLQLLAIVLVFVIFISLAVYFRRRPDYHKRFMTLAMLTVLGPALTRLPFSFIANHDVSAAIVVDIACILACIIVDAVMNRRLHPVFGWGGAFAIGSIFAASAFAQSSVWAHVVRRLLI